jgi:serine/threonine-protein kinase HipA
MNYEKTYIFYRQHANDQSPVLIGMYQLEADQGVFRYDDRWLEHDCRFALDPFHLPLSMQTFYSRSKHRTFSALMDSAPDRWGVKLLTAKAGRGPKTPIELLLKAGGGAGCLAFSGSRERCFPYARPRYTQREVNQAILASQRIDADEIDPDLIKLVKNGSSMGGARPKLTIIGPDNHEWILKFNRTSDRLDIEGLEAASLLMAQAAGIEVPTFEWVSDGVGGTRLAIKRFDRDGLQFHHFVSAATLLYSLGQRNAVMDAEGVHSYMGLAESMMRISDEPFEDMSQLALRMLFNSAISNTDDHLKNHGALLIDRKWRLAPAYDVLPTIDGDSSRHAIGIGRFGSTRTAENLASDIYRFRLTPDVFAKLAGRVERALLQAADVAEQVGLGAATKREFIAICDDGRMLTQRVAQLATASRRRR